MLALLLLAPSCREPAPVGEVVPLARPYPEAELRFRQDPRWLGGDAALSVPLDAQRTLWLFGDSFVALDRPGDRRGSKMVRNSVALQDGIDLCTADLRFHWQLARDGGAASFFAEEGERWFWPGHGLRLDDGPLVLFLYGIVATPGVGLGFDGDGYALVVVEDPALAAGAWQPRRVEGPPLPFDAVPASAVVRDGAHVVALAIRQRGAHAGALVRYEATALARGELQGAQWWCGDDRGWLATHQVGAPGPAWVIDDAGAECSLHWEPRLQRWLHVASYGFGASTIGVRTAVTLTGPWSVAREIHRPPESDRPRPFVYAAKAHPGLRGPRPDDLVVTYATNSFEFRDLFDEDGQRTLYWPRCVLVDLAQLR